MTLRSLAGTETWSSVRDSAHRMRAVGGRRLVVAFLLLLVASATEGVSLLLLIPLLHIATRRDGDGEMVRPSQLDGLDWLPDLALSLPVVLATLVVLVTAQSLLTMVKSVRLTQLLLDFTNSVRLELFEAVGHAKWSKIAALRLADLEHALTSDIDRIQGAGFLSLSIVQSLVVMTTYGVLALLVSVPMSLISLALGLVLFVLLAPFRRNAMVFGEQSTSSLREQYRTVSDFLNGLRSIKAINTEESYIARLRSILERLAMNARTYSWRSASGGAIFQVASVVAIAIFAWVAIEVLSLSLGQIVVMVVLFARVTPRFMSLQSQLEQLLSALPAYRGVRCLTAELRDASGRGTEEAMALSPLTQRVTLAGVCYRYPGAATAALNNVTFDIPAGQITALVGPSGAGKSTLADVVLGLLEPDEGTITVDGTVLDRSNSRAWRDQIAYVTQDVFLMHDTVAANLRLGARDRTEAELWEALTTARAADFMREKADGLNAVAGDRGVTFSGGQRQRLALAAALLRTPRLLILDEATSALDETNQQGIVQAIGRLRGDVAVLIIAHRPAMVAQADHIVIIEEGRVVEAGPRESLLERRDGRYTRWLRREDAQYR